MSCKKNHTFPTLTMNLCKIFLPRRDGNKKGRTDPEKVLYKERKIKRLQKEGKKVIDKERRDKGGRKESVAENINIFISHFSFLSRSEND